jgi:tRNA U38,U39,U40 pseudouridine synthase TruA
MKILKTKNLKQNKNKGFTTQEGTWKTIENVLFNALTRTKLIVDRQSSNYHRCGRTDKGLQVNFFLRICIPE